MNREELFELADELQEACEQAGGHCVGIANRFRGLAVRASGRQIQPDELDDCAIDADLLADELHDLANAVQSACKEVEKADFDELEEDSSRGGLFF